MHKNVTLVYDSLIDINKKFTTKSILDDFPVYGEGGFLDSLDLVRLIITIERKLSDREGKPISLSSEKAMSYRNNPYRSFFKLVEFVEKCLQS